MAAIDVVSQQKLLKIHLQLNEDSPKKLNSLQSGEAAVFATLDPSKNWQMTLFQQGKGPTHPIDARISLEGMCGRTSQRGAFCNDWRKSTT